MEIIYVWAPVRISLWAIFSIPLFTSDQRLTVWGFATKSNKLKGKKSVPEVIIVKDTLRSSSTITNHNFTLIFYYTKYKPLLIFTGLISLFNGISTFMNYSMPKPSMSKDNNDTNP